MDLIKYLSLEEVINELLFENDYLVYERDKKRRILKKITEKYVAVFQCTFFQVHKIT